MTPAPFSSDCGVIWHAGSLVLNRLLSLLDRGELRLHGLMPWSSNYTFLGQISDDQHSVPVIYKPARGERPLWDFPRGTLAKRETAAYVVCRALGWNLVPPTVLRNGPHGRGSVQLFVEADQDAHYFTFRDNPDYRASLQALSLLDIVTNNADRKAGHCLSLGSGCIVAIDQGLCFHVDAKLRTVIWDFAGDDLPAYLASDLQRLLDALGEPAGEISLKLSGLLAKGELTALIRRTRFLLAQGRFPDPPEDRRAYPWPLV